VSPRCEARDRVENHLEELVDEHDGAVFVRSRRSSPRSENMIGSTGIARDQLLGEPGVLLALTDIRDEHHLLADVDIKT
jgi:hypothetical protein